MVTKGNSGFGELALLVAVSISSILITIIVSLDNAHKNAVTLPTHLVTRSQVVENWNTMLLTNTENWLQKKEEKDYIFTPSRKRNGNNELATTIDQQNMLTVNGRIYIAHSSRVFIYDTTTKSKKDKDNNNNEKVESLMFIIKNGDEHANEDEIASFGSSIFVSPNRMEGVDSETLFISTVKVVVDVDSERVGNGNSTAINITNFLDAAIGSGGKVYSFLFDAKQKKLISLAKYFGSRRVIKKER